MKNKEKGVTLVTLAITVTILIIIAGISFYSGKDTIKKAELEELKTNMLLIEAKAREYVEDATFKMGINPTEVKKAEVRARVYAGNGEEGAQLAEGSTYPIPSEFGITDQSTCYWLTPEAQIKWGLDKIKIGTNEKYLIQFDEQNVTVEIYNTKGYQGKYSLTEIEKIQQ